MLVSQEFLTPEKCAHYIIIRGLVRVLMVTDVKRVLFFLTKKGFVNHGILGDVPRSFTVPKAEKVRMPEDMKFTTNRREFGRI